MTGEQQKIEDYARAFEGHLACPAEEKARRRAELVEYLSDAADDGALAQALERFGTPEQAAQTFAHERSAPLASMNDRLQAAVVDNLPLIGVTIALVVQQVQAVTSGGGGGFTITAFFPPVVYADFGNACVSLAPFLCGVYESGPLYDAGVPIALAWSIIGLGIAEARTGTTPGKRWRGLKVVTGSGLRIDAVTGVLRRLSFLVGPFAWLDWIPALWGDRRRILDRMTETRVIAEAHGHERGVDADRLTRSPQRPGGR